MSTKLTPEMKEKLKKMAEKMVTKFKTERPELWEKLKNS